ncbi:MAG: hypothetical protein JWM44_1401 [Bacilli bacterium]|nr:hypothetical protein [Bacilli bacterium]
MKNNNLFSSMKSDNNHCFLCGLLLDNNTRTDEHVIPGWLQNRHKLWNQKMTLPNGTEISYKQLKIPCCSSCNNVDLSRIEREIELASKSYDSFIHIERQLIFQWVMKIYYGLKFKDLSLLMDRTDPDKGTIIDEKSLSRYRMMHEFLQSTKIPLTFQLESISDNNSIMV